MYNIKYTKKSLDCLKKFINSYKGSFIRLLKDSGLFFEEILIQNYIEIWDKFYEDIVNKLELILKQNNVLWRFVGENNEENNIIKINNFKLFVSYKENNNLRERYVENIEFFRK